MTSGSLLDKPEWDSRDLDALYERMLDSVYGPRSAQGDRGTEAVGEFRADDVDVNKVSEDPELVNKVRKMVVDGGGALARRRGKKKTISVIVDEDAWKELKRVAREFNLVWGGEGNISGLMQLIGEGKLEVILRES